jgi:hypothetical protein
MKVASDASALLTRLQACDGPLNHFIMRYVFPIQGQAAYADKLAELCCGAPKFDFLRVNYRLPATFPWKDEPVRKLIGFDGRLKSKAAKRGIAIELASLMALVFLIFLVFGSGSDSSLSTGSLAAELKFVN